MAGKPASGKGLLQEHEKLAYGGFGMKINADNYMTIQGWMRTELGLKGNDLLVYAVIWGFSQIEEQRFTGSLQYLADWCGATKQGIQKNLKSLLEKGVIKKYEYMKNNVKFVEYEAIRELTPCNRVHESGQQSYTHDTTKFHEGGQQSCTNNIKDNIKDNKEDNKDNLSCAPEPHDGVAGKEEQLKNDFEIIYALYPKKVGKTVAFANYKLWVSEKGKDVGGHRYRLTNRQIYMAVRKYAAQQEEAGKELEYWKNFDTLMGRQLLDYVDWEEGEG